MPEFTNNLDDDVLIKAEHVSKKFCRSLKRSLWYGAQDVANALMPWKGAPPLGNGEDPTGFPMQPLRKDEFWAVRDVSFEVRRGECLGLIGHNGAGKSTLLKILNSLNSPSEGRVTLKGRIGALIELSAGFNPILTGRENIFNQAALLGFSRQETNTKFDSIVDFSELDAFLDMPLQNYSSGMKVRLGFAVASQMEPDILIIDEVLAVGDVGFRLKCLNKMAELLSKSAVIIVSHSMSQIHRVCTDVMVMENGVATYSGDNISAGVNKYFSGFTDSESSVTGSGEIVVNALTVASDEGEYTSGSVFHLDQKSKLLFQFDLQADSVIQKCRLGMVIWNSELYPIADMVQRGGALHVIEFDAGGKSTVSIEINELNLAAGRYTLSLHFTDPTSTRVYCRVDNAIVMVVNGTMVGGGGNLIESVVKVVNRV